MEEAGVDTVKVSVKGAVPATRLTTVSTRTHTHTHTHTHRARDVHMYSRACTHHGSMGWAVSATELLCVLLGTHGDHPRETRHLFVYSAVLDD